MHVQADGHVAVTNSVLQGAGDNCRAVDVRTKEGGEPRLYINSVPLILSPAPSVMHVNQESGLQATIVSGATVLQLVACLTYACVSTSTLLLVGPSVRDS